MAVLREKLKDLEKESGNSSNFAAVRQSCTVDILTCVHGSNLSPLILDDLSTFSHDSS